MRRDTTCPVATVSGFFARSLDHSKLVRASIKLDILRDPLLTQRPPLFRRDMVLEQGRMVGSTNVASGHSVNKHRDELASISGLKSSKWRDATVKLFFVSVPISGITLGLAIFDFTFFASHFWIFWIFSGGLVFPLISAFVSQLLRARELRVGTGLQDTSSNDAVVAANPDIRTQPQPGSLHTVEPSHSHVATDRGHKSIFPFRVLLLVFGATGLFVSLLIKVVSERTTSNAWFGVVG
jgi:hypothetical protein